MFINTRYLLLGISLNLEKFAHFIEGLIKNIMILRSLSMLFHSPPPPSTSHTLLSSCVFYLILNDSGATFLLIFYSCFIHTDVTLFPCFVAPHNFAFDPKLHCFLPSSYSHAIVFMNENGILETSKIIVVVRI